MEELHGTLSLEVHATDEYITLKRGTTAAIFDRIGGRGDARHSAQRGCELLVEYFGFDLPEVERLRVPTIPEWT